MLTESIREPVLLAFLQGHSIAALAAHFKLPILDITSYLNSPEVAAIRESLNELAAYQAELATTHARIDAILKLHAVIKGEEVHPEELRAASTLLRGTPKSSARARTPQAPTASSKSARSAEPRPAQQEVTTDGSPESTEPDAPASPTQHARADAPEPRAIHTVADAPTTTASRDPHARDRPQS